MPTMASQVVSSATLCRADRPRRVGPWGAARPSGERWLGVDTSISAGAGITISERRLGYTIPRAPHSSYGPMERGGAYAL